MKNSKKSDSQKKVYVMTVGTGTAGKHSNLAQGLVNSIKLRKSDLSRVLLVPSMSEESGGIAELVVEEFKDTGFDVRIYSKISEPDGLLSCRREFRDILTSLKQEQVILNPTSGTKQMTSGATLAAVDLGIGFVEFISGEREDGVVKTGTELIQSVDAARMQAEQTLKNILVLLENGDFTAASVLAEDVEDYFPDSTAVCRMLAAWNRLNYAEAVRVRVAPEIKSLEKSRETLGCLNCADVISLERAADVLALAARDLHFNKVEEALSALYRTVELLAKCYLVEKDCPPENWFADKIIDLFERLPNGVVDKLKAMQKVSSKPLKLGLNLSLRIVASDGCRIGWILDENTHYRTLMERNETRFGHGQKTVKKEKVENLYNKVLDLAVQEWPELAGLVGRSSFPDVEVFIKKEMNLAEQDDSA